MSETSLPTGRYEADNGGSYYALDVATGERVLGPYGSREYAETCADRYDWPNDLNVTFILGS